MNKYFFYIIILTVFLVVTGWQSDIKIRTDENSDIIMERCIGNGSYDFDIKKGICTGLNFDVEIIGNKFCLISNKYYELDSTGTILSTDESVMDLGQNELDFGPAITISPDSTVHLITRGTGGKGNGFNLMYSMKSFGHEWQIKNRHVGNPVPRNYVVDIVASGDSAIYAHTREVIDVNSTIHFYVLKNGQCDSLGAFISPSFYRSDSDFRMKMYKDSIFLVSGYPWPDGSVFYMRGRLSYNLPEELESSRKTYKGGLRRKGQPDIAVDKLGTVHFTYGAEHTIYYSSAKQDMEIVTNKPIMDRLGDWHLNLGLSALAASDDGKTIVAVGLKTDETKEATKSDILWTMSNDAGISWTSPKSIGVSTNAGEGRCRPRLLHSNGTFYLFYNDNSAKKISMAVLKPEITASIKEP